MFKPEPIDVIDSEGNWIATYRYEPFLKKWFFVTPEMAGSIRILDHDEVPKEVITSAEKYNNIPNDTCYSSPIKIQIQINRACNYKCEICYASSDSYAKIQKAMISFRDLQ